MVELHEFESGHLPGQTPFIRFMACLRAAGSHGGYFMARSIKAMEAVAGAGIEAQALASRMLALQADAGLTIALRMPILWRAALGERRGQREAVRAVVEKVSAVMESGFAASQASALFWWRITLTPAVQIDLGEATAAIANSTLEPFSRRTRANATRLGRPLRFR